MWTTHMDSKKMLGIPLSSSILGWIMWIFFGVNISWLTITRKKYLPDVHTVNLWRFFFHLGFWYTRGYWGCNLLRLILGFIICYADRRWCLERNECIELLLALLLGKIVDHLNDDIFRKIIGGCLKMGDTIHTLIKIAIQIEKNWKIHRMIHGVL
jgi:hypothetical protein